MQTIIMSAFFYIFAQIIKSKSLCLFLTIKRLLMAMFHKCHRKIRYYKKVFT